MQTTENTNSWPPFWASIIPLVATIDMGIFEVSNRSHKTNV